MEDFRKMKKPTQQFTLCIMKMKFKWLVIERALTRLKAPKELPSGFLTK